MVDGVEQAVRVCFYPEHGLRSPNRTSSAGDAKAEYDSRAQFYFAYSSLVLYSFGLENALEVKVNHFDFTLTRSVRRWISRSS